MGEMVLTVWSVCIGDKYDSGYVYALKEMVEQNLTVEHEFRCITTRNLEGIITRRPPVPYQSWWSKIGLFYPRVAAGPSLYFDLDVVITGNIDFLVDYTQHQFAAPANWAQSGHGGIQSSVMAWSGNWHEPYYYMDRLIKEGQDPRNTFWGDQELLWSMLGENWAKIPNVGSYKYHVRPQNKIPDWMKVCVFHGKPDPHEVADTCILPFTSTLRSSISGSITSGSDRGLSGTG